MVFDHIFFKPKTTLTFFAMSVDTSNNTSTNKTALVTDADLDAMLATGKVVFDEAQVDQWKKVGKKGKPTTKASFEDNIDAEKKTSVSKKYVDPSYPHARAAELNAVLGGEDFSETDPTPKAQLTKHNLCTKIDNYQWICTEKVDPSTGRTMCDQHHVEWISGLSEERAEEARRVEERRAQKFALRQSKKNTAVKAPGEKQAKGADEKTTEDKASKIKGRVSKKKKFGPRGEGSRVGAPKEPTKKQEHVTVSFDTPLAFKKALTGVSGTEEAEGASKSGSGASGAAKEKIDNAKDEIVQKAPSVFSTNTTATQAASIDSQKVEVDELRIQVAVLKAQLAMAQKSVARAEKHAEEKWDMRYEALLQDLDHANALCQALQQNNSMLHTRLAAFSQSSPVQMPFYNYLNHGVPIGQIPFSQHVQQPFVQQGQMVHGSDPKQATNLQSAAQKCFPTA